MTKIYKPYEDEKPPKRASNPGSEWETEYKERYDENGHPYLVETGKVNVYEKIQSYRDECEIQSILSRYAAGDQTVMNRPGYYIDTTVLPTSYTEYFNLMQEQKEKFNSLPLNIRKKFNNSFEEWAASAGNAEWLNKMGIKQQEQPKADTKADVKEDKTDEQKQ
uniref:Internal scaffolding protein n=1 Tax=Dulem virus 202 TaxID=3145679 RepID=A0AAU8AZ96_9VIRU